jgi:hypothetical protein
VNNITLLFVEVTCTRCGERFQAGDLRPNPNPVASAPGVRPAECPRCRAVARGYVFKT